MPTQATWDGQPISQEKPHGVTIVVYRWNSDSLEFLILHRAYAGSDYEGEWAWTPPSGARHPGEDVDACARRELFEETGLELSPNQTDCGTDDWWVYLAEATSNAHIHLSMEHDRYEWVSVEKAVQKCTPAAVSQPLQKAAARLLGGEVAS
jgi:8-oxo-dGTP pyrophosphatase MutT (NUDIX family)